MAEPAAKPNTLPIMVMNPDWQGGYNFYTGRWFGDEGLYNAYEVIECLKSQGHKAGPYSGETSVWDKGKNVLTQYWRVFVYHPKEKGYYAWFAPETAAKWTEPFDQKLATWFEFAEPDKK